jgi:hypothetical protein
MADGNCNFDCIHSCDNANRGSKKRALKRFSFPPEYHPAETRLQTCFFSSWPGRAQGKMRWRDCANRVAELLQSKTR